MNAFAEGDGHGTGTRAFSAGPVDLAALIQSHDMWRSLAGCGEFLAVFGDQDSGCFSCGIRVKDSSWFIKIAQTASTSAQLRRAIAVHRAVQHPAIVAPAGFAEYGERAAICYPWHDSQVPYHPAASHRIARDDPAGPMYAFRAQPLATVLQAVDTILDAHLAVAAAGLVALDFYDGSMLWDPATQMMRLVDLDDYRPAPVTVGPGLMSGSVRFLSPEEQQEGAILTQRTTVYTMGRMARILLDAGDQEQQWRGSHTQLSVIKRATRLNPAERYPTVSEFVAAWRTATQ